MTKFTLFIEQLVRHGSVVEVEAENFAAALEAFGALSQWDIEELAGGQWEGYEVQCTRVLSISDEEGVEVCDIAQRELRELDVSSLATCPGEVQAIVDARVLSAATPPAGHQSKKTGL